MEEVEVQNLSPAGGWPRAPLPIPPGMSVAPILYRCTPSAVEVEGTVRSPWQTLSCPHGGLLSLGAAFPICPSGKDGQRQPYVVEMEPGQQAAEREVGRDGGTGLKPGSL